MVIKLFPRPRLYSHGRTCVVTYLFAVVISIRAQLLLDSVLYLPPALKNAQKLSSHHSMPATTRRLRTLIVSSQFRSSPSRDVRSYEAEDRGFFHRPKGDSNRRLSINESRPKVGKAMQYILYLALASTGRGLTVCLPTASRAHFYYGH